MTESDSFILPEWLDGFAVEDSFIGQAYETTSATVRASLKKTIACLACFYGEIPQERERKTRFNQELIITECDTPVNFCFVLCPAEYPYPERFVAALMPAIFSGVESVVPCFITSKSTEASKEVSGISSSLLAAVDLAGIECTYLLDNEDCNRLFSFAEAQVSGHIVELLKDECIQREKLPHFPYTPLWAGRLPINIAKASQSKGTDCSEIIRYTHGLSLHPSLQDIWAWQELTVDMFRKRSVSFE